MLDVDGAPVEKDQLTPSAEVENGLVHSQALANCDEATAIVLFLMEVPARPSIHTSKRECVLFWESSFQSGCFRFGAENLQWKRYTTGTRSVPVSHHGDPLLSQSGDTSTVRALTVRLGHPPPVDSTPYE